ncbi:MAG: hypothetical protein GXZ11_02440 [Tissierellia bacterium]|nr:hypothetical protein [Tissierellia bacterium]
MTEKEFIEFLTSLASLIAEMFGDNCEVVLSGSEQKVIAIFNGHVSGREVGSPILDIAKKRIAHSADGYFINYDMRDALKKNVKSSTISTIFNGQRYALCINYDCEDISRVSRMLSTFLTTTGSLGSTPDFSDDNVIKSSLEDIVTEIGKPLSMMNKQDRLEVINRMNNLGLLKMQKSIPEIARIMGISRYTVYNYMKELDI